MLFFSSKKIIIIVVFSPKLLYVLCSLKFSLFHSLFFGKKMFIYISRKGIQYYWSHWVKINLLIPNS